MPATTLIIQLSDTVLADLTSVEVTTAKGKSTFPLSAFGQGGPFSTISSAPEGVAGYCVAFEGPASGPNAFPGPDDQPTPPSS